MLLTNNYYRITNKVYKFISEENFYLKNCVISKLILKCIAQKEFILSSKNVCCLNITCFFINVCTIRLFYKFSRVYLAINYYDEKIDVCIN